MLNQPVTLQLSPDEALVLFEFLSRWCDSESLAFEHPAEEAALLAVSRELDRQLAEPFSPSYTELLEAARQKLGLKLGGS